MSAELTRRQGRGPERKNTSVLSEYNSRGVKTIVRSSLTSKSIQKLIEKTLDDNKAEDIVTIDLIGKSSFADSMVVASGFSHRHVGALADHVAQKLKEAGLSFVNIEGQELCDWVLIDAGDVVVHIFRPEVRQFYNLEKMWSVPVPVVEAMA